MPTPFAATCRLAALGAAALLLAGCSDGGSGAVAPSAPTVPSAALATASDAANPYGEAPSLDASDQSASALTVVPADAAPRELQVADLVALGSRELTVNEPFVKRQQTFTGTPLADVLTATGIPPQATLDTVGADDYVFSAPVAQFVESGALLAYEVDGAPISPEDGGPIRLVYPDGTVMSGNPDAWTWRLVSLLQAL